jgi:hypothetical protein
MGSVISLCGIVVKVHIGAGGVARYTARDGVLATTTGSPALR